MFWGCRGCTKPNEQPGEKWVDYIETEHEANRWWNWVFVSINSAIGVSECYLKSGMVGSDSKNLVLCARDRLTNLAAWIDQNGKS